MPKVFELSFSETDLGELQGFLDDLFQDNSLYFERLVSALSRIGLHTRIESHLALFPHLEVVKSQVISTLRKIKGVSHEQVQN